MLESTSFIVSIIRELEQEAKVTRRLLSVVPFDQGFYRPHEKSESLGRLAIHVAEIIAWFSSVTLDSELDFIDFEPKAISAADDLVIYFDKLLERAISDLNSMDEENLNSSWSMKHGDELLFSLPKREVLRKFCLNHHIHHRAQLGVYLRMLGIDVPATYGPSADDYEVTLIEPF